MLTEAQCHKCYDKEEEGEAEQYVCVGGRILLFKREIVENDVSRDGCLSVQGQRATPESERETMSKRGREGVGGERENA